MATETHPPVTPGQRDLKALFSKPQRRAVPLARAEGDAPQTVCLSTERAVDMWGYKEILLHEPGAIILERAKAGLSFNADHDRSKLVGRLTDVKLDADKALRSPLVYATNAVAKEVRADIEAGVRPGASLEYNIYEWREEKRADGLYIIATLWEPMGCSSVTIEADIDSGFNRAAFAPDTTPTTEPNTNPASRAANKERTMRTPEEIAADEAANKAALETRAAETRTTATAILEIAGANKIPMADAQRAISENWPVQKFLQHTLEKVRAAAPQALPDVSVEDITGSARDAKDYSYCRAISAAIDLKEGRTPPASMELDMSRELQKRMPGGYASHGGMLIPMRTMKKRDGLDSITATKGTELKQNMPNGELIEYLYNASVLMRMGMKKLTGLTGPAPFPKLTGVPTHYWVGENPGAAVAKSNPTLSLNMLSPKTLMGTVPFSRQLAIMGTPDVESLIKETMAKGSALAIDLAGIYGIGAAGEPMGIYNAPDVNVKAMGGAVDFAELVSMATSVASDNALIGGGESLGYLTTPGMAGKLISTLEFSAAGAMPIWKGRHDEGIVSGYRAISSNQISSVMTGSARTGGAEHGIIFGDFSQLLYGSWGIQEIIVDPITRKGEAMIEITSFEMADFMLRHGESFTKATGATLA